MSKINVVGLGYIGLPTALMFSACGAEVIGTDRDEELVGKLKAGILSFEESGMYELFQKAWANGISFTTEYAAADIYIIAVPTPYEKGSKKIDPKFVVSAVISVLSIAPEGAIIVLESTIPPGTVDRFIRPVVAQMGFETGKDIHLAHAPERILPGNMIYELQNNSRIIGADSRETGERVKAEYALFCKSDIIITSIRAAEMTKVVENTFRDINIAFANELARICRRDNMDVYEIIRMANRHPRVNILQPGPGVGGHCISVDPWFLVGDYPDLVDIILAARNINDDQPHFVLKRIREIMKAKGIKDVSKIGLYGLTYKEDVNDTRESPTLQLLEKMDEHLAFGIKVYDPLIDKQLTENQYFDFDEFLDAIELLVVLVSHTHIRQNIDKIRNKVIFDTKNIIFIDGVFKL